MQNEIETLRARIAELEEQLSAIGAGGVETLRKPVANGMDAQLVAFIEKVRDFKAQAVRVGSSDGPIRWDVEYGHYGDEVSAKTLTAAIAKAIAAKAREAMQAALQRIPAPDYDPRDVAFTAAPQTTEDQSRAAFEAYYSDNYEHETAIIRNAEGSYIFPGAEAAWLTWQAAVEWANNRRPGQRA